MIDTLRLNIRNSRISTSLSLIHGSYNSVKIDATSLLVIVFAAIPIVDSINGYYLKSGLGFSLPISKFFRALVVMTLIIMCGRNTNVKRAFSVAMMLITGLALIAFHDVSNISDGMYLTEIGDLAQWLYAPLICILLICLSESNVIEIERFSRGSLCAISWIVPITIIVPYLLGVGYGTYGGDTNSGYIGYKAFYYSTNALSYLLAIAFSYSFHRLINEDKSLIRFLPPILCCISMVLVGTKSSIVFIIIGVLIAVICRTERKALVKVARITISAFLLCIVLLFVYNQFSDHLDAIINRAVYVSSNYSDLLSMLTSGRTVRIEYYESIWSSSLESMIFGIGNHTSDINWCEMDYHDVLFEFGILGFLFLSMFSIWVLVSSVRFGTRFDAMMIIISLLYAAVVGHVFSNAMAAMVFALVFSSGIKTMSNRNISKTDNSVELERKIVE